jgi:acetolactate synthase-1/2/3 large subunit
MGNVDGGELLIRALKSQGVNEIFALSGGHLDPMFQACVNHGIRLIDTRHEAAAAHMADGYARTTGKPGVCLVTAGPGVANAVTGIANAWMDATPVICIGGRSPLRDEDKLALQNLDQVALMSPVTKLARTIYHTDRIPEYIASAYRHAVSGRPGPVFLDIPIDVLFRHIDESEAQTFESFAPEGRPAASASSVDQALDILTVAQRPAIFVGGGVMFSGAHAELRTFAEMTRIPVFPNLKARGAISEMTDLGYGGYGVAASPVARAEAGGGPDVILMLGGRVGMFTGSSGGVGMPSVIPNDATLIQLDIEPEEIGRCRDVQLGLVGDIKETLKVFIERARGRTFQDHEKWIKALVAARAIGRSLYDQDMYRPEPPIHEARLAREIADFMDGESIIVADGGETSGWMAEQAIIEAPGHWLSHGYLGCLGTGIPFAIAAKIAHPDRRVLAITGDGSAGLNFSELDTAVRHGVPIVVVVNNDQGWGMIRHGHVARYGADRVVGAELGPTRYDLAAAGFGAHAELVTEASEIRPALERAFASGKAACINVMTDPTQPHVPPAAAAALARRKDESGEIELPYYGRRRLGR